MAVQPAREADLYRNEEPGLIWKKHQELYIVIGFFLGLLAFPALQLVREDIGGLLGQLVPEAAGIIVTVLWIERLQRQRDERNAEKALKEQLVRDAGSTSNEVAKNAVHQLRKRGWLEGDHGLLAGQDLRGAYISGANMEKASLQGTDLGKATLQWVNLEGTNLERANLSGAYLREAIMKGGKLETAVFDETTILPDGRHWSPDIDMTYYTNPPDDAPWMEQWR
jgi:hypothetical protein